MPPIFVWAVVTGERGVLLVPARSTDGWMLPGAALRDDDESVEAAIMREVERSLGVRLEEEPEFLTTEYERRTDGTTLVHNLFHIPLDQVAPLGPAAGAVEWLDPAGGAGAPVPEWLGNGLRALLGEDDDGLSIDLAELQQMLGDVPPLPPVIVVTGPAGAGKSTVSAEICRRFPRAAYVSADLLREMVVSGNASPVPGRSDPAEAAAQNRLVTENAATLARNFTHAGMVVVIDEVLETREGLDDLLEALGPDADLRFVTLLPGVEELARRDGERAPGDRMGARSEELRRIIAGNGETRGIRLDPSGWSIEQTVDIILERLEEARIAPGEGAA
jgi:ADP-ribose pyrophosphatase YjhB (NUDIX family)